MMTDEELDFLEQRLRKQAEWHAKRVVHIHVDGELQSNTLIRAVDAICQLRQENKATSVEVEKWAGRYDRLVAEVAERQGIGIREQINYWRERAEEAEARIAQMQMHIAPWVTPVEEESA